MPRYGKHLINIVADIGYESIENYAYLNKKQLITYIKPANFKSSKKKKAKDINKRENMTYLEKEDAYVCKNGIKLTRTKNRVRKYDSGYQDPFRTYRCYECIGSPFNSQCIKSRKAYGGASKTIQYSPDFETFRGQSNYNITTEVGIAQRISRSIQAEGMISKLKDD